MFVWDLSELLGSTLLHRNKTTFTKSVDLPISKHDAAFLRDSTAEYEIPVIRNPTYSISFQEDNPLDDADPPTLKYDANGTAFVHDSTAEYEVPVIRDPSYSTSSHGHTTDNPFDEDNDVIYEYMK